MLSKRDVDALRWNPDGPSVQIHFDPDFPTFGVRLYPSGSKSYVMRYGSRRRRTLMVLGPHGALTPSQARELARAAADQVRLGQDPVAARKAASQAMNVSELCDVYLERHVRPRLRRAYDVERYIERFIRPALGSFAVDELTRADVAALHARIGRDTPYQANRVLEVVRKMFHMAITWGLRDATLPDPGAYIERYRERSRERWATPEELPKLRDAIEAQPSPYVRGLVWLLLMTGVRLGEALGLTWDRVDLQRREARLVNTKNGRERVVPLSDPAVAVLRDLPRTLGTPRYVFPGQRSGRPLPRSSLTKPWDEIRTAAGMPDLRLHDLRRTCGSWLATSGVGTAVVGKVLGHLSQQATQVYARVADTAAREALEQHGERMAAFMEGGA